MKITLTLILTAISFSVAFSADGENWYQIRTKEIVSGDNYRYYASSNLSLDEISDKIVKNEPIIFKNLTAWDKKNAVIPWSEYDANVTGTILITASNINSVMPLNGDPKIAYKLKSQDPGKDFEKELIERQKQEAVPKL